MTEGLWLLECIRNKVLRTTECTTAPPAANLHQACYAADVVIEVGRTSDDLVELGYGRNLVNARYAASNEEQVFYVGGGASWLQIPAELCSNRRRCMMRH